METYFAIVMAGQLSQEIVDQFVNLIKAAESGIENIMVQTYATPVQTEVFLKVKHTCDKSVVEEILGAVGFEVDTICPYQAYRANTIDEIVRSFTPGYELEKGPEVAIHILVFKERIAKNLEHCMNRALAAYLKDDARVMPNFSMKLNS